MSKIIKINGVDFTNMITPVGYEVQYESVQGENGGLTLDGSYLEDEIAQKAVIKATCMPMNEDDLASLLSNIYGSKYASVYYFDPKKKGYLTITARRSVSWQKYKGKGSDGKDYWSGTVITLTEQ